MGGTTPGQSNKSNSWMWAGWFSLVAICLIVATFMVYHSEWTELHEERYRDLQAVAKLKVHDIQLWRQERLNDASDHSQSDLFRGAVTRLVVEQGEARDRLTTQIRQRLHLLAESYAYSDALVLAPDGRILIAAQDESDPIDAATRAAMAEALRSGNPALSSFYRCPHGIVHIDAVAALRSLEDQSLLGYLVLHHNADAHLFPLIQSRMLTSETAETLIVQRSGDDVLFLNNLRHREGAALTLRIPLSQHDLPAVHAVEGKTGMVIGRDYRGVEVLADLRHIPGSNWYMVAKWDVPEIAAGARDRAVKLGVILVLLLLLTGMVMGYTYRYRQARVYRSLYQSQEEKHQIREELWATLLSIGDAVIATDTAGTVTLMNPVAESLTGWSREDAKGQPVTEVFRIVNAETRQPGEDPVSKVLRVGEVVGLANHTMLLGRDGREHQIADSGSPITDEQGNIIGVVLVFRDVTNEYAMQKALADSEQRYRRLFEDAPVGIFETSSGGKPLVLNQEMARILGCRTPAEALSHYTNLGRDLYVSAARRDEFVAQIQERGAVENFEYEAMTATGRRVWLGMNARIAERMPDGSFRIEGFTRDITAQKQSLEALQHSEELLRETGDIAQIGGWEHDLATGEARWTKTLFDIIELDSGPPPGVNEHLNFYPPADRAILEAAYNRARNENVPFDLELQVFTAKKRTIWSRVVGRAVMHDGVCVKLRGVFQDITERKLAEAERERLLQAIHQAREAIVITDAEGRIQFVNPAYESLTGFAPSEVKGEPLKALCPEDAEDTTRSGIWEVLRTGKAWFGRIQNCRKDGTPYTEDVSITPVRDASGAIVNLISVRRDVTETVQLEEQLIQSQKVESIGRLTGGVAHDFNNLLVPILSFGELLLDSFPAEDPRRRQMEQIIKAGERARDLTRKLLAYGRKQILEVVPLDLNDVVQEFRDLLLRTLRDDIKMELHLTPGLPSMRGDRGQIEQIIMNLAINAQDAMPHGGTLTVSTSRIEPSVWEVPDSPTKPPIAPPGRYVELTVTDTGLGMDEPTLASAFEPFFTTKQPGYGTGLGLSTVYGIVKQHRGYIDAESQPGKGTTFRICLPTTEQPTRAPRPSTRPLGIPPGGGETILVVEDEPDVLSLILEILGTLGYTCLKASNGAEALDIAAGFEGNLDLLLTDVVMPGMNGRQLYDQLAAQRPGLQVLYTSGYTEEIITRQGVLEDGIEFLQKPFTIRGLSLKIREILDGQEYQEPKTPLPEESESS